MLLTTTRERLLSFILIQTQNCLKIWSHHNIYRLETMDENINQLKTTLNEHTTLLTQILSRLPKTP